MSAASTTRGDDGVECTQPQPPPSSSSTTTTTSSSSSSSSCADESSSDDGRVTVVQDASNYVGHASAKAHDARWVRGLLPVNNNNDDDDSDDSDDSDDENGDGNDRRAAHNGRRRKVCRGWRVSSTDAATTRTTMTRTAAVTTRLAAWRRRLFARHAHWLRAVHGLALLYVLLYALQASHATSRALLPLPLSSPAHTRTLDFPDSEARLWPYGMLALGERTHGVAALYERNSHQHYSNSSSSLHDDDDMDVDDDGGVAHVGVLTHFLGIALGFDSSVAAAAAVLFMRYVMLPLSCPTLLATVCALLLSFRLGSVARHFVALCGVGVALLGAVATLTQVTMLWCACSGDEATTRHATAGAAAARGGVYDDGRDDVYRGSGRPHTTRALGDVCAVPFVLYTFCSVVRCGAPLLSMWCVSPLLDAMAAATRARRRAGDDMNDDDDDDSDDNDDVDGDDSSRRVYDVAMSVRWRVWLALPLALFALAVARNVRTAQPQHTLVAAARALSCATMLSVVYATWRLTPRTVATAALLRYGVAAKPHQD